MSTPMIEVRQISVNVRPHFWSRGKSLLSKVSFKVTRGHIFGFIGPNGAGKTTTIKTMLGLLRPDAGEAFINGLPITAAAARASLGFMPERAYFPETLTARELVLQHALLAGLAWKAARQRTFEVLERVGLHAAGGNRLGTYSKGMLQRAGLAQALVGDPELVVLDEPMSGLDPIGRRDVREIMLSLRQAGKTVFFSTHILPDVELICDEVAILAGGQVRHTGPLEALTAAGTGGVEVTAEAVSATALAACQSLTTRQRGHGGGCTAFQVSNLPQANALIDLLRRHNAQVTGVQSSRGDLERLFVAAAQARPAEVAS